MSQKLVFRPQAREEIEQAAAWYDERGSGLSAEFLRALDATVGSIVRNPRQFPTAHREMRRALLRRFPYSLIFTVSDEEVLILSCTHWRQDPRRWRSRG